MNPVRPFDSYKITIENPKGSHKSFEVEGDPVWAGYPLKGVTYPVDYGFIEGYASEDGEDLDVFVGSGNLSGLIRINRRDVPIETKSIMGVTEEEWDAIIREFQPVIEEKILYTDFAQFEAALAKYKR